MLTIRKAEDRGNANFGWLDSHHTFSFGQYYDPAHMGFGPLRVINDDQVAGGGGFGTHSHSDMEIISYVIDGALEHKDNIGNGSTIKPGDVQRMTAGTGIAHSEYNHSATDPVHFLQIWVIPESRGLEPGYEQTYFDPAEQHGQLRLVGSRDGRDGSVTIHQDINLYAAHLSATDRITYTLERDRHAWVHVVRGGLSIDGHDLKEGDGVAIADLDTITIEGQTDDAELLLFDMAA